MGSNAMNWVGKDGQKENGDPFEWVEFSSDDSSDDNASLGRAPASQAQTKTNRAKATKKVARAPAKEARATAASKAAKAAARGRKKEAKRPRKVLGERQAGDFKFGANVGPARRGTVRTKSPAGKKMILSRRLSRRIMKGSPLRSPICACQLNFGHSAAKERKPTSQKKGAKGRGNSLPRAGPAGAAGGATRASL